MTVSYKFRRDHPKNGQYSFGLSNELCLC